MRQIAFRGSVSTCCKTDRTRKGGRNRFICVKAFSSVSIAPGEVSFTVRSCSGRTAEVLQPWSSLSGRENKDIGIEKVRADVGSGERSSFVEFPRREAGSERREAGSEPEKPALVRVRLSVHYRVHSRQLLCIGGSQIPFGWSFLSIAKLPMEWNPGDLWTTEIELPAGTRIEYKYVILEEQDWTMQASEDAEGVVTFEYRTQPEGPPDVQQIQKQMAIVAWQPGPNRYVQVPSQEEIDSLIPGEVRDREPARPPEGNQISRTYGQQAKGGGLESPSDPSLPLLARVAIANRSQRVSARKYLDEMAGTWETLSLQPDGVPWLERRDVWGLARENTGLDYGPLKNSDPKDVGPDPATESQD